MSPNLLTLSQSAWEGMLHEDVPKIMLVGVVAVIWILSATISSLARGLSRERTKREIAAYIAEGTMTTEQGEKIIKADRPADKGACKGT